MSLLSKLRAALAVPAAAHGDVRFQSPYDRDNHLWSVVAPDWFPDTGMNRAAAMGIPAVSRARRVICHSIAALPLRAYRGPALLDTQPIWLDRTDGPVSPYHRMLWTVDDLFFHGVSCWAVSRNSEGVVNAADRIPWDRWHIDPDGTVVYHHANGAQLPAAADSVVVIPGSDEGLLNTAPTALRHARDLLRNASRAAENPAAYIDLHQTNDYEMSKSEADRIRDGWIAARRGENGGVAFSSAGIEVRELGAPIAHLLVEGRNAAALDVARAVGIPGSIVDANNGSSLTYETSEQKARDLVDYGLSAYMAPISARLGMDDVSPRGTRVAFDLEDLIGPGATEGAPDDGGDSSRPRPVPTTTDRSA